MMGSSSMADDRDRGGRGERAEHERSRKFWWMIAGFGVLGGILGGVHSVLTHGNPAQAMPGSWAIALAVLYAVGLGGGSLYFFRSVDELELRDNLHAALVAIYFYTIVYPVWFILWKGGLVMEPGHEALFIGTLLAMTIAYFWKKLRP